MKYFHHLLSLMFSTPLLAVPQPIVLDDFETKQPWELKEWGDSAELSVKTQQASQGRKALVLEFAKAATEPHPRGIVLRRSLLGRASDYQDFIFDIFVETRSPLQLHVSVDADQSYERSPLTLKPGLNKDVHIPLLGDAFQAKDPDGKIVHLNPNLAIGTLILSFLRTENEAGRVYLDNIRAGHRPEWSLQRSKPAAIPPHPIRIQKLTGQQPKVKMFSLMELTVDLDAQVLDPYDSKELELKGIFTSPAGQKMEIPGFLYAGKVGDKPVEGAIWKIRFTPSQAGEWNYHVEVRNRWKRTQSANHKLLAEATDKNGFVRVNRSHPTYFAFDSGRFYYPMGQNVAWLPMRDYERYFTKMAANGENWARIWMTNWSFGIEWKPMGHFQGLGNYNLDRAQKLDELLRLAEKNGIYLQLVFDFHGAFSNKVNPEWANSPFNVTNGGFLTSPDQFFTDPRAKDLYKKRLRYIMARWGHSPHVMAWEFFNEVSFTDDFNEKNVTAWHQEMATLTKQQDPYQHLTTTSYGGEAIGDVYKSGTIDFAQYHVYTHNLYKQLRQINNRMSQYQKPYFVGEFGSDSANGTDDRDLRGVFLHAGIWSQFMQPAAGNAMPWWWDSHIEPNNLYYHFAALSRFATGLDRREHAFTPVRQKLRMEVGEQAYEFDLIGLQSPEYSMFWLCDSMGMNLKGRSQPLAYEEVKIALENFQEESYEIEFWDTYRGAVHQKAFIKSGQGKLALELPRFSNDIAFKIRPKKALAHEEARLNPSRHAGL
ncbi:MAG TPA: DUF5060 domain-containing protein [Oligoflexus sp.]|uniref:DUF5060 domain-containing protein n=1 Tax=Oligoflexus sp. TaxID=1971216 RepID=UPI002D5A63BF|nr:DUF5060 domain-containing protein [Oligoflexus sp.]HYX33925.1 DUF5060 domain-containing protein [Oligoflexus sp.]